MSGDVFEAKRTDERPQAAVVTPCGSALPVASPVTAGRRRAPRLPESPGPGGGQAAARDPERQLWCAVIIHALYEATGRVAYAERGEHASVTREALAWFRNAGEDFHAVCELAGFAPSAIRAAALRVIECGRLPRVRISKAG